MTVAVLLLPTLAMGQSGASLQVAATVLNAEPSRSALTLATQALKESSASSRESRFAQVTVSFVARRPEGTEVRRVRVDFLRN